MREWRANIEIAWLRELSEAAGPLAGAVADWASEPLPVVPASLRRDDPHIASIRGALRVRGVRTVVVAPRAPAAVLTRRGRSAWRSATIDGNRWRVDGRLAAPWVALAIVDAGSHTGPFALDLPARFLHPADRLRLAARPDRLRLLADIAAIAPPATCLMLTPADGGWLALPTRDPIAAELWALGLAERFHPADVEMQGPWEEPAVQRATELGLGVRVPDDMRIDVRIPPDVPMARALLTEVAEHLGLALDADAASG